MSNLEEVSYPGSIDTVREDEHIFHCGLQTYVEKIGYDWHQRHGQIWARGPVDMSGSIKLFEALDRDVTLIFAYLDGKPDVAYRKRGGGWQVRQFHEAAC